MSISHVEARTCVDADGAVGPAWHGRWNPALPSPVDLASRGTVEEALKRALEENAALKARLAGEPHRARDVRRWRQPNRRCW